MILVVELKVKGTDAKTNSLLESLCGAKSPIEYPMHKAQWIEFSLHTQRPWVQF